MIQMGDIVDVWLSPEGKLEKAEVIDIPGPTGVYWTFLAADSHLWVVGSSMKGIQKVEAEI